MVYRGFKTAVASYFDSTSNHNCLPEYKQVFVLLHILILHQTTTTRALPWHYQSCFIFWFYIKPQLLSPISLHLRVASYFDSTSNHNSPSARNRTARLLHILILHQTTTGCRSAACSWSCFIFWFYIKPQLHLSVLRHSGVASYFDSTSNHNTARMSPFSRALLHILILHQTTTCTI